MIINRTHWFALKCLLLLLLITTLSHIFYNWGEREVEEKRKEEMERRGREREEGNSIWLSRTYQQYQTATSRNKNLIASVLGKETSSTKKEHVSDGPSALGVLGDVSNQGDVVRDAVASVVGVDDASFVEYHKFEYVKG